MTRTIFLGKPEEKWIRSYTNVTSCLKSIQEIVKPDLKISDLSKKAEQELNVEGEASYRNFHSLGHGVGIEVHELPNISTKNDDTLKPGNIITLEPSVYHKNEFGIRVENMIHVTKNSSGILSKSIIDPIILA